MSIFLIGMCCLLELIILKSVMTRGKQYARIGSEQNIKLWTVHSINGMLCVMIYLAFFSGKFVWEQGYFSKILYVVILLVLLLLVEFISPSRQFLFFFHKTPKREQEFLHEIEESYDRFYQFLAQILLLLMINLAIIKLCFYFIVKRGWKFAENQLANFNQCMVYAMGVFVLLFSCISFRQIITQLSLTKNGYFRQDVFQTLRKKDEIQERLQRKHRKL
ncbi:MAG: hypothetical protein HFJ09_16325 [Lachnospiraceae bacterium]|nr:hypothetical protein [Lachnospiraceae bacterium]